MRQKSVHAESSSERIVKNIRRATRRHHSAEEKIRIVLDGLRGESMRMGNADMGAIKSNQAVIFDQLLDSNPLLLTGNTDTVYQIRVSSLDSRKNR